MPDHEAKPIDLFSFKESVILSNRRGTKGYHGKVAGTAHLVLLQLSPVV